MRLVNIDDAIKVIDEYIEEYSYVDENGLHTERWCAMQEAKMVLEDLPTVELPEVSMMAINSQLNN